MQRKRVATLVTGAAAVLLSASPARAHALPQAQGTLVGVSVEIDGRESSLYAAPDGSGRYYLEARAGSRYAVSLANRTGERVGVVLTVDGLNAISGERDTQAGRMYVLDPWQSTRVQGWRTSLSAVRQFTFVDEKRSYAARSGKANEKMGWIEIAVYRERRAYVHRTPGHWGENKRQDSDGREEQDARDQAPAAPAPEATASRDSAQAPPKLEAESGARARSYPGTGWGDRAHDPVVLVSFDPEKHPSECVTLRYEYRSALVALGVLPAPVPQQRDRLWQRERAEPGFAQPPRW
jgi:hypothetical protein